MYYVEYNEINNNCLRREFHVFESSGDADSYIRRNNDPMNGKCSYLISEDSAVPLMYACAMAFTQMSLEELKRRYSFDEIKWISRRFIMIGWENVFYETV